MATDGQVHEACEEIAGRLASFRADINCVAELRWCLAKLAWLREEYRGHPAAFAQHIGRVKEVSQQVYAALADSREALTTKYLEAAAAVNGWEAIREACRDALLELAGQENAEKLESSTGWIEIKRSPMPLLPKPGTAQRERLLAIITDAQLWADVAYPNAARLLKAIDGGRFTPQQAAELARLCPTQMVCRLAAHPA